ncbi:MAG TPA: hypothetical protein VGQ22_11105 [Steroidobacteraceae bacterium]|nr:hypothetical protein [Steroidobacteraceae bacterium]
MNAVAAALARWYADHSSIRHLWAIEDPAALVVLVTLEPTSDGDDILPIWLANQREWASRLQLVTRREVRLRLIVADAVPDAVTVAEVSWRDAWPSL